uniref:beta-ketoacyl-ACP synthase II n=1 Tax=Dialister succinatiphilus TaxID=487173 RepID=UPI004038FB34
MEKRRVVITGMGVVSPVGIGTEEFWNALMAGKSGIGPITEFDPEGFPVRIAGEVKDFDAVKYVGDRKAVRHMDRNVQFAVAAAKMAVEDAKLDMSVENPDRVGTIIGTGIGGINTMEETVHRIDTRGPAQVNPFAVPLMIANMAAGQVSINFGLMGPVLADVTACASGNNAIGRATRTIQYGDADVMFAGGTEAAVAKTPMAGFAAMKALSSRECPPEEASCPFDVRRDGFVLGEGSGVLILEELEHAKKRGAHIYAEVIGYGSNGDAYHITAPRPGGELAARCMKKAIDDAGISPDDIDYINAHGTSTGLNDKNETKAIKDVLGKHAYDVVINSTKSMTGHLLGAAGAIEAIVCVLSIEHNKVHQTLNLKTPDPECDLDYVPEGPRDVKVDVTMSNAFGFGGHNAVVIMRRYEE